MASLLEDEERVRLEGAKWLGANRVSEREFHSWFGLYPRTVVAIAHMCEVSLRDLVKLCWWMHQYPTRKEIKAKGVSASRFVLWVWQTIRALDGALTEVCCQVFCPALTEISLQAPVADEGQVQCAAQISGLVFELHPGHNNHSNVHAKHGPGGFSEVGETVLQLPQEVFRREARSCCSLAASSSANLYGLRPSRNS